MKRDNSSKKAQGLPMYAIGIIILGIIILAVVLIFIFGVSGQGTGVLDKLFGAQEGVSSQAADTAREFTGSLVRNFFR